MIRKIQLALVALLLPALCLEVQAQRRTDVINMYNGDRVTGEIVTLQAGILEFKTDSMGTLKVEWQDIAAVSSRYLYEVRLSNGERHLGNIVEASRPGQLSLVMQGSESGQEDAFEWIEVVELRPIEDHWSERLEIYLAATFNYTKASSVAQTNFNTEVTYTDTNTLNKLSARHTRSDNGTDITNSSRANVSRAVWTGRSRDFRAFWGSYESNDELGLDHRYAGGAGIGRFLVDTHRMRWMGTVGLQVLTERALDEEILVPGEGEEEDQVQLVKGETNEAVEGVLTSAFTMWRLDTPELDLNFTFQLYPNLSDTGRLRGDTDLRLRWEIIEDLFWDVTAWGTYDSEADSDNVWDYGVSTGVGWEF